MLHMKKARMLQIVAILQEAKEAIVKIIETKTAGLPELLGQCQELAILLGNDLEQRGEAGLSIVHILEEYCESLYQISMQAEDEAACKPLCEALDRELRQVEDKLVRELSEKKEVAFFPYKASMWDSLESVWLKANEDENCDAYVIPIPYYDKNPDGSYAKVNYEGFEMPEYVPIVSWEEYKLEERMPDEIYFHNPYDNWNLVTEVHSKFFASELRKYTKNLVYIPYFVHPNDQVAEHFCVLPGTIYADKVVLQSEKVQKQYIDIFAEKMSISDKAALKKKFVAEGSPKFAARAFSTEVPEDWKPFLEDKSKKVIFFNPHLAEIMDADFVKFIKKLDWIFELIKTQDKVVWLWRPHPLMLETIRAMNPAAEKDYLERVKHYKSEKLGIFDETSDLHRAVNLADAYYGSGSSVVELFKQAGKPVMIMDVEILE